MKQKIITAGFKNYPTENQCEIHVLLLVKKQLLTKTNKWLDEQEFYGNKLKSWYR